MELSLEDFNLIFNKYKKNGAFNYYVRARILSLLLLSPASRRSVATWTLVSRSSRRFFILGGKNCYILQHDDPLLTAGRTRGE
eukprot:768410-Hanusia_phi.AAC.2